MSEEVDDAAPTKVGAPERTVLMQAGLVKPTPMTHHAAENALAALQEINAIGSGSPTPRRHVRITEAPDPIPSVPSTMPPRSMRTGARAPDLALSTYALFALAFFCSAVGVGLFAFAFLGM